MHDIAGEDGMKMTDSKCPTLGIARDLYDALLADLTHPRASHSFACLYAPPERPQPPDPQSSVAPVASPP